jgi:hypothetical protein
MELTSAQRKVAFAVIVLVLAALGYSLFMPRAHGTSRAGSAAAASPHSPAPAGPALGAAAPAATDAPGQASSPSRPAPAAPDIYRWLPFTPQDLKAAAALAVRFSGDYGTFSYSQNTDAYLAPMRGMVSSQLAQLLARAFATPGVASVRSSRKQVSAGSAAITSLRAFGPSSLTFVVAITQRITDTRGGSQSSADYAVTVTGGAGSWQVTDIELASAGNL